MKKLAVLFWRHSWDLLHAVVPRKIHRQNPHNRSINNCNRDRNCRYTVCSI